MRMGIGLGVGINRSNYAQGIFNAYSARVVADGGVVESGSCVDAVSSLLQSASLLLIPSGYKSTKLYSEIPTNGNGDLTWTRASTALRTNSSGLLESMGSDVPRLSYMYGSCPSVLLEPQRTNLLTYSNTPTDSSWSKLGLGAGTAPVVTANAGTSPEGMNNATRVQFNCGGTTSSDRSILQKPSISLINATNYAASIYVKAYSSGEVGKQLRFIQEGVTSQSIITLTDSWQRVAITGTSATTTSNYIIETRGGTTTNTTADVLIYGAQLEQGAYPTTYIPTTTATATRVADSASKTGISSLIGQSEGVLFAEVQGFSNDTARFAISDGTNNNNIYIELSASNISAVGRVGAVNQFSIISSQTLTNVNKIAIKYKTNDFALYVNGVQVGTDTSGSTYSPNTLNTFRFDRGDGFIPFYGNVKQIILFPNALTNAQLISLTT